MGMHALNKFNVCSVLQCSQETLHSWLTGIESKYHASNPYHNSTHAADVLHATAFFLNKDRLQVGERAGARARVHLCCVGVLVHSPALSKQIEDKLLGGR